jgi:hypothetical protein
MKTNVTLKSTDRNLFGVVIGQNTKDSFLSVTDLSTAYERAKMQYGWSDRNVYDVMETSTFKERVYYILENQRFINSGFLDFIEKANSVGIIKVLKSLGVYKTTGARNTRATYANPYIWVLLAMELNPMIYAKVVQWLTDSLIFNRIDAGREYIPMNTYITTIVVNPNYGRYATLINEKVFGIHQLGIRNNASADQLRQIADIEKQVITAIDMGWIKSENELINFLNR